VRTISDLLRCRFHYLRNFVASLSMLTIPSRSGKPLGETTSISVAALAQTDML